MSNAILSISVFITYNLGYIGLSSSCIFSETAVWAIWIGVVLGLWCRDVIREATYMGEHTIRTTYVHKQAFNMFIASEIMFFMCFFWGYLYNTVVPAIELGVEWPPVGVSRISPWGLPCFNTAILLTSGATVTWSVKALRAGNLSEAKTGLFTTIMGGLLFFAVQSYEYYNSGFTFACSVYSSFFYIITGFHGVHVVVGTIMLVVCYYRMCFNQFTLNRHAGYECAIVYWHFVDIVWILVWFLIYMPGKRMGT